MASTNKTPNLNLNSWLGSDQPTRSDFVYDNEIIDTAIATHLADTAVHVTSDEKAKLSEMFISDTTAGDGESAQTYTLDFTPSMLIYYQKNYGPIEFDYDNSYTVCHAGIAIYRQGASIGTAGLSIGENSFTVKQTTGTPSRNVFVNLNQDGGQYVYIAFR